MSSARSKRMIESVIRRDEIGLQKVETVTNINCSDNVCIQNQSVADSMRMEGKLCILLIYITEKYVQKYINIKMYNTHCKIS